MSVAERRLVSPQRENFLGLNAGRTSWCVAVLSSSIGASSSAEPHFFLEWNNDASFLFLFRSLAWVTWKAGVDHNKEKSTHTGDSHVTINKVLQYSIGDLWSFAVCFVRLQVPYKSCEGLIGFDCCFQSPVAGTSATSEHGRKVEASMTSRNTEGRWFSHPAEDESANTTANRASYLTAATVSSYFSNKAISINPSGNSINHLGTVTGF